MVPAHGNVERLRAESASLRRALQDAELEIQHMTVAHQRQVQEMLKVTQYPGCWPLRAAYMLNLSRAVPLIMQT